MYLGGPANLGVEVPTSLGQVPKFLPTPDTCPHPPKHCLDAGCGWLGPRNQLAGLGSSQNPDVGPLLLFLAGGKGRNPTIGPANKIKYHLPPLLPTPPSPETQAFSTLLPSCFPQGHHPSSSEVSSRFPGHSHQLFSHPSQDPGVRAGPPPFPGLQGPHSTWLWDHQPPPGS